MTFVMVHPDCYVSKLPNEEMAVELVDILGRHVFYVHWADKEDEYLESFLLVETKEAIYGLCLNCGAIEAKLDKPTGTRDFSKIGESANYPTGYGCEFCGD